MSALVAVNGPIVAGVEGIVSVRPAAGITGGMGRLKATEVAMDDGVAPLASTVTSAVPSMAVLPSAAAALAIAAGMTTEV